MLAESEGENLNVVAIPARHAIGAVIYTSIAEAVADVWKLIRGSYFSVSVLFLPSCIRGSMICLFAFLDLRICECFS